MEKENALKDFLEMIYKSWTWAKMSEEEKKVFLDRINSERFVNSLKGNFNARWEVLNNYYFMYLLGLGYDKKPGIWREN